MTSQWPELCLLEVKRTERKEPLGRGSYGMVIEVSVNETICAAKVMHEFLVEDAKKDFEAKKKRFLEECARNSRMLHPNLVQLLGIYYSSPKDKLPWLIMEMMNTSLSSLIKEYETTGLPLHVKLSILLDTSKGLQYLHSKDVIHRDLSPNNILLTKQLVAKVAEFGVAKKIKDFVKYTETARTKAFMAPEALLFNSKQSKALDVFSIGCVNLHVICMEWPIPVDQTKQGHLTQHHPVYRPQRDSADLSTDYWKKSQQMVLSEVKRRERYLQEMNDQFLLKRMTIHCLQDEPEDRPTIIDVVRELQSIKATTAGNLNNLICLMILLSLSHKFSNSSYGIVPTKF